VSNVVGLYKDLDVDEKISFEGKTILPTVFIKEAEIKKLIGRETKEVPISYAMTKTYLTNKRLLFLILYQIETRMLTDAGAPSLSGVTGSWFEMPLNAIIEVEIRPVFVKRETEMMRLAEWIPSLDVDKASGVEIVYDERLASGRIKDYMESMLGMGFFSKLFKRIERVFDKLLLIGEETASIAPMLKNIVRGEPSYPVPTKVPTSVCQRCGNPITSDFKICPYCGTPIEVSCSGCGKEIRPDYAVCPFCGKPSSTIQKKVV